MRYKRCGSGRVTSAAFFLLCCLRIGSPVNPSLFLPQPQPGVFLTDAFGGNVFHQSLSFWKHLHSIWRRKYSLMSPPCRCEVESRVIGIRISNMKWLDFRWQHLSLFPPPPEFAGELQTQTWTPGPPSWLLWSTQCNSTVMWAGLSTPDFLRLQQNKIAAHWEQDPYGSLYIYIFYYTHIRTFLRRGQPSYCYCTVHLIMYLWALF